MLGRDPVWDRLRILASPFFPAVSNYVAPWPHRAPISSTSIRGQAISTSPTSTALRDGTMSALDLTKMEGIITFPSYHAGLSAVTLWGFWAERRRWLKLTGHRLRRGRSSPPRSTAAIISSMYWPESRSRSSASGRTPGDRWVPAWPRSRHCHSAVHVQRLPSDISGFLRRQIRRPPHRYRHPFPSRPSECDRGSLPSARRCSASVIAEVMNPGATQLTVMPRLATSCANAFDMPISPAFDAT